MCIRTFQMETELNQEDAMASIATLLSDYGIGYQVQENEIASELIQNRSLPLNLGLSKDQQWTAQDYIRFEFGVSNTGRTHITIQTMQIGSFMGCFLGMLPLVFLTIVTKTVFPLIMIVPLLGVSWYSFHYLAVVAVRRKIREKLKIRCT